MKKFTRILAVMLIAVMAMAMFASCGDKKTNVADGEKITVTVGALSPLEGWQDDELCKFISDKFGIEFDVQSMTMDGMAEKTRLLATAGTLPDMIFSEFVYNDYISWGKQGLVKALPEDYAEKYPNIKAGLERTRILEKLEKEGDGVIFGIPRAMSSVEQYGFGSDVPNLDRHGFIYRKDWADKLGIETSDIMAYDDFINMAVEFKKADLGGVGQSNNMGVAVSPANAPFIFVHAQNPNWNVFYKNSKGKYVSGYNDKATVEGLKAYKEAYDKGVLHPTFFTHKASDIAGYLHSGKAGILFTSCGASDFQSYKTTFGQANPGLNPDECLKLAWIEGKDGKVRAREMANYWSCLYFRPEIDDEAYNRLLSMIDFFASEEGGMLLLNGFEGKDYEVKEDGTISSLIPPKEDGSVAKLSDVYPSADFFGSFNPVARIGANVKKENVDAVSAFMKAKFDSKPETKKLDLDVEFYNSDIYSKFSSTHDISTIMAEIITKTDDVEKEWKNKLKSIQNKIDEVSKEMNKTIGK